LRSRTSCSIAASGSTVGLETLFARSAKKPTTASRMPSAAAETIQNHFGLTSASATFFQSCGLPDAEAEAAAGAGPAAGGGGSGGQLARPRALAERRPGVRRLGRVHRFAQDSGAAVVASSSSIPGSARLRADRRLGGRAGRIEPRGRGGRRRRRGVRERCGGTRAPASAAASASAATVVSRCAAPVRRGAGRALRRELLQVRELERRQVLGRGHHRAEVLQRLLLLEVRLELVERERHVLAALVPVPRVLRHRPGDDRVELGRHLRRQLGGEA
jgi:hypothetical protein